ncbi:hypothetical protein A2U01_0060923, partial [Trifolium medium]|nr:hypothetical protein [Trifolium medium]
LARRDLARDSESKSETNFAGGDRQGQVARSSETSR